MSVNACLSASVHCRPVMDWCLIHAFHPRSVRIGSRRSLWPCRGIVPRWNYVLRSRTTWNTLCSNKDNLLSIMVSRCLRDTWVYNWKVIFKWNLKERDQLGEPGEESPRGLAGDELPSFQVRDLRQCDRSVLSVQKWSEKLNKWIVRCMLSIVNSEEREAEHGGLERGDATWTARF